MNHVGELAAFGAVGCWTISALSFAAAGRRVGSLNVNLTRLGMALVMLAGYGWIARGQAWPVDATATMWKWLLLSGLVGFFLGDLCLLEAYVLIGARLSTLLLSLSPPLTALVSWLMLGERLRGRDWLGMAIMLTGIGLVLVESHGESTTPVNARKLWWGVLLGLGAAAGQAAGLVFSKRGMDGYDAFAATQIRVVAGLAGFVVLFAARNRWRELGTAIRQWPAMWRVGVEAVFGPFVGVGLALVAVQRIPAGVAATILALMPVLVIPPSLVWHGERVGWRAWVGTLAAVGGVALLCL